MVGSCNAVTTRTRMKGMFGPLSAWYNPSGVANLLSIPVLMEQVCKILYDGEDWALVTPQGAIVDLETEKTGVTRGFLCLDMRKFKQGFTMIETIQGNVKGEGFSRREVLDAKLARETPQWKKMLTTCWKK